MAKYFIDEDFVPIKNAKDIDPQALGEAFEDIIRDRGELKPEALVEEARDPAHPAHRHFDWDDEEAAGKWRLQQARQIIRIVSVREAGSGQVAPAFVSIRTDGGVSYRAMSDVIESADLTDRLLKQAESDLEAFEVRYRRFKDYVGEVRKIRERISARRTSARSARKGTEETRPAA